MFHRLLALKDQLALMDITALNLFAWCKCLRHAGRIAMFTVVAAIVGLATYATFATALIPGITSSSLGVSVLFVLLTAVFTLVVRSI